jgi:hypothetical protein
LINYQNYLKGLVKIGLAWCIPIIPAIWEAEIGGSYSEAILSKSTRPYLKNKVKTGGIAQVDRVLTLKHKTLSSNCSTGFQDGS